jgi:hypothetical protein
MADSDVHEAIQLDADIDALVDPTVSELWRAMHGYPAEATGAVATHRALAGGGTPTLADVLAAGGDPDGNPVTEPLYIDNNDTANPGLTVDAAGANGRIALFRKANGELVGYFGSVSGLFAPEDDAPTLEVSKDQVVVNIDPAINGVFQITDGASNVIMSVVSTGGVTLEPPAGSTDTPLVVRTASGSGAFAIDANGGGEFGYPLRANAGLVIYAPSAPADGDINAGECALWFDDTNGASKLMIKGKSANGTVVTGNVTLT